MVSVLNKSKKMPWINKNSGETCWIPEVEPEKTENWQNTQMSKCYLKPDGSKTSHPGWYFGNGSYASDEYFYYNYGWYTIIDDIRPDSEGGNYLILECPVSEWEVFDTYKIKKTYKKYLHVKSQKPEFQFGELITHSFEYDDINMTCKDVYEISYLEIGELSVQKNDFLNRIRIIRNYILEETDHFINICFEKNQKLSQDFLEYRQNLRNPPQEFDFKNLTESDHNKVCFISDILLNKNTLIENKIETLDINDISFFPQTPSLIILT